MHKRHQLVQQGGPYKVSGEAVCESWPYTAEHIVELRRQYLLNESYHAVESSK